MFRITTYRDTEIKLVATLNSGSTVEAGDTVLTHTLSCSIGGDPIFEKDGLSDAGLLESVTTFQGQAEARIDIIGTPADSPVADDLLAAGFVFES